MWGYSLRRLLLVVPTLLAILLVSLVLYALYSRRTAKTINRGAKA